MDVISFGRCVCGFEPVQPSCAGEPWAAVAGYGDCLTFLEDDHERGLAFAPAPGSIVAVRLAYPFLAEIGAPFWCLFDPPAAALDGYIDYARDLPGLRLVQARIVGPPTQETDRQAYARAEIIELVEPASLLALAPTAGSLSHIISRVNFYHPDTSHYGQFSYKISNIEGETISWTLMSTTNLGSTLLIFGESGQHENRFFAGNRPLNKEEARNISLAL